MAHRKPTTTARPDDGHEHLARDRRRRHSLASGEQQTVASQRASLDRPSTPSRHEREAVHEQQAACAAQRPGREQGTSRGDRDRGVAGSPEFIYRLASGAGVPGVDFTSRMYEKGSGPTSQSSTADARARCTAADDARRHQGSRLPPRRRVQQHGAQLRPAAPSTRSFRTTSQRGARPRMVLATAHLDRLVLCDPSVYGRACAIVRLAAEAAVLGGLASSRPGGLRTSTRSDRRLTVVLREQTRLSLDDIGMVLNREDHSSMQFRIKRARPACSAKLEPFFSRLVADRVRRERIGSPGQPVHRRASVWFEGRSLGSPLQASPASGRPARSARPSPTCSASITARSVSRARASSDASIARSIVFYLFGCT